jgi:hypothetical protein
MRILCSIGFGVAVRGVDHGEDTRMGSDWNVKMDAILVRDTDEKVFCDKVVQVCRRRIEGIRLNIDLEDCICCIRNDPDIESIVTVSRFVWWYDCLGGSTM